MNSARKTTTLHNILPRVGEFWFDNPRRGGGRCATDVSVESLSLTLRIRRTRRERTKSDAAAAAAALGIWSRDRASAAVTFPCFPGPTERHVRHRRASCEIYTVFSSFRFSWGKRRCCLMFNWKSLLEFASGNSY